MFRQFILSISALLMLSGQAAYAEKGELIWRDPTCFFFVLKAQTGFALFEFLGGPDPVVGSVFEGDFTTFGSRKIDNITAGQPTMAYTEVFTDTKKQMEKKIPKFCKNRKEFEALVVQ
jgi:hypothetical protein